MKTPGGLTVRCPTCGAAPGVPCERSQLPPQRRHQSHQRRTQAAMRGVPAARR